MRTQRFLFLPDALMMNRIIRIVVYLLAWSGYGTALRATVAPNGQYGQCGPYYLWYQVGPESALYGGDYIDLCEITFDVSQVYTAFDFVYFTDTPTFQRSALDQNHDGISDQYFQLLPQLPKLEGAPQSEDETTAELRVKRSNPPVLRWKPEHGCVRINLRNCRSSLFNEQCGYAMISLQPRPGQSSGRAEIPVHITKHCPPYGNSCDETLKITHTYSDCYVPPPQDFVLNKSVDPVLYTGYGEAKFNFTLTILNAGERMGSTVLTDTFTDGTMGGQLALSKLDISCSTSARCTVTNITDHQIQLDLTGLRVDETVKITYTLTGNSYEIPSETVSYFTNTAKLTNGHVAKMTFGIRGEGDFPPRTERPKPTSGQHPSERQN